MVACTQPRRVAAMSVAKRVADEMDGEQEFKISVCHDTELAILPQCNSERKSVTLFDSRI
jgi:hypothetical protein